MTKPVDGGSVTSLLTIDPGLTCCGWAFWNRGVLVKCGLSRTQEVELDRRVQAHGEEIMEEIQDTPHPLILVIEKPEVYPQRFMKGDPNDLIDLAVVVGGIVAQVSASLDTQLILPKTWKGQVPDDVLQPRTLAKLRDLEVAAVKNPVPLGKPRTVPPSLKHNMMDAVGIGLWALGR